MAIDLARIAQHADSTGELHARTVRKHLMITDGIVAGEGDGPLSPRAVDLGYLSFSDDVVAGDHTNAVAMGFDPESLPIISRSSQLMRYSLSQIDSATITLTVNGIVAEMTRLRELIGRRFLPPQAWRRTL
jgi:uncharacterized protein (DUF362 family)